MPLGIGLANDLSLRMAETFAEKVIRENIVFVIVVSILIIVLVPISIKRPKEVYEELKNAAYGFGSTYILKDILAIMYKNFPPFIQSNLENKIDDPKILHLLTPMVSSDHNGYLNISDVQLDYTEKRMQIAYKDGTSKCYLEKIEFWPSRGKFTFHFNKVNNDLTVERIAPIEFTPDEK